MNFSVLFVLGVSIFGGLIGALVFQKLRIPQVVGFIVIGLIIGSSGLEIVTLDDVEAFEPLTLFALGIIGFLVGGELKVENFKKYGGKFLLIMLGEGVGAFALVGGATGAFMYFVSGSVPIALAAGVVFGAIASATDPASTIDVLWEYRALGVLTTSLTAVIALDDALAMVLYGLGSGAAKMISGDSGSIASELGKVGMELAGALVLGFVGAIVLRFLLRRLREQEKGLAFAVGLMLLLISVSVSLDLDVILSSMTLGCVLVNTLPKKSRNFFGVMRSFSTPIYVLFFVLAGARISMSDMPGWLWGIVIVYVVCRTCGKMIGTYVGARYSQSEPVVRRYLGLGLFAQGGVAIGLSIMASQYLGGIEVTDELTLGEAVVFGIAATTFIVQLAGPPMVKLAIKLSNETGRNVTREDVIDSWRVKDVMEPEFAVIDQSDTLAKVAQVFVEQEDNICPVVDETNNIVGVLSLESLKEVLTDQDAWRWLVAADVMKPADHTSFADSPLQEVLERMNDLNISQMPVVKEKDGKTPVGIVDLAKVRSHVDTEVFRRRRAIEQERKSSP